MFFAFGIAIVVLGVFLERLFPNAFNWFITAPLCGLGFGGFSFSILSMFGAVEFTFKVFCLFVAIATLVMGYIVSKI